MKPLYRFQEPDPESKTVKVEMSREVKEAAERYRKRRLMRKVYEGLSFWAAKLLEYNRRKNR